MRLARGLVLLAFLAACSSEDPAPAPAATCVVGKTEECPCLGSTAKGVQTCGPDGSFGVCTGCPAATAGAGGASGAGGAQGGSGGTLPGGSGGMSGGSGQGGASATGGGGVGATGGGGAGATGGAGAGGGATGDDPTTCDEAALLRTNVGCEFWPTVTANAVWSIFDFAVVVANTSGQPTDIQVTRGASVVGQATIAPGAQVKVYLPWVSELKGPDSDNCGTPKNMGSSVRAKEGAYRLTSTRPVAVYQFNALEAKGEGGLPTKNWSSCPGSQVCQTALQALGCFSFSNDASLLLPTTALGTTYRVVSPKVTSLPFPPSSAPLTTFLSITGTEAGTTVTVSLPATGGTLAGGGVAAAAPGTSFQVSLGAGEVVELIQTKEGDLSGTLITSNLPVQVIAGAPCANVPDQNTAACDHLEESMPPAEALGKTFLIAPATGPKGNVPGQVVHLVGHANGTKLTYKGKAPVGAPTTIESGQKIDLGLVKEPFEIDASQPLLVGLLLPGGQLLDPSASTMEALGDPSLSVAVSVEQFRKQYAFLSPSDYEVSYADVVAPTGAKLTLDGQPVTGSSTPIEGTSFRVVRLLIDSSQSLTHVLSADQPVGLQLMGYSPYTSYQYPGGGSFAPLP